MMWLVAGLCLLAALGGAFGLTVVRWAENNVSWRRRLALLGLLALTAAALGALLFTAGIPGPIAWPVRAALAVLVAGLWTAYARAART